MFTNQQAVHFWNWFSQHSEEYRQLFVTDHERAEFLTTEFQVHLWDLCPQFGFDIWVPPVPRPARLIISPHRKARYIKYARALVDTAPYIPGWKITALRPPMGIDFFFDHLFPSMAFRPESLRFMPYMNKKNTYKIQQLYVYIPGYNNYKEEDCLDAACQVLENLVGEEVLTTVLGDIVPMELNHGVLTAGNTYPITDLPSFVGGMSSGYVITNKGTIRKRKV